MGIPATKPEESIAKRAFLGIVANGLSFVFTFLQSIILVPIFLNTWGKEKYGVWIGLYAFVTLIKTIDAGHQNYVGNEINKVYHKDIDHVKVIVGSSFRVAYFLGLVELVVGGGLFYFYGDSLLGVAGGGSGASPVFWANFVLLLVWFIFGSVGGILARVLVSIGKFSRFTYWGIAMKLLEMSVLLLAAFKNFSIFYTALTLAASSVVYYLIQFVDMKAQTKILYPWWAKGNLRIGFQNLWKAQLLTITGFIDQFSNSFQIISVSNFLGAHFIPVFSTLKTLTNIALQMVNIFASPLTIDIIRSYIEKDRHKLVEFFSIIWFLSLLFIYLPFLLMAPFVESIYRFWTHNLLAFDPISYCFLSVSVCMYSFGTPFRLLLFGVNHLRSLLTISIVRLVILGTILIGIKSLGLVMVSASVMVSELFASILVPLFFISKEFKIMGGKLDKSLFGVAFAPVLVLSSYYVIGQSKDLSGNSMYPILAICLLVMVLLVSIHWKLLDKVTKSKIKNGLTRKLVR